MSKVHTFYQILTKNPAKLAISAGRNGLLNWMRDEQYLKLTFRGAMGYPLDLNNPKTFNEKLQWLKLHNRQPEYIEWVDKFTAKQKAAALLGVDHIVPLLGAWEKPEKIDFDVLPDKFVLKCNHDQGSVKVIDKSKGFDRRQIVKFYQYRLSTNPYWATREWPYKDVPRKIIAEKYMVDESGAELKDYKINCFNGEPKYIQVMSGRSNGQYYLNHFDMDWNPITIPRRNHTESPQHIEKPKHLQEMIEISKLLSKNIPYVRIDLYHTEDQVYFGEITFFPMSGFVDYADVETDLALGNLIKLPIALE